MEWLWPCFSLILSLFAVEGSEVALCIVGEARSFTVPYIYQHAKTNLVDSLGLDATVFLILKTPLAYRVEGKALPGIYDECGESKNCRWEVEMLRNASRAIDPDVLRYILPKRNRIDACKHVGMNGQERIGKGNFGHRGEYKIDRLESFLGQLVGWERCLSEVETFESRTRSGRPFDAVMKARPDSIWFERVNVSHLNLKDVAYLGDFWPGFRKSLDLKAAASYAGCNQSFMQAVQMGIAHAPREESHTVLWDVPRRQAQVNATYTAFGRAELLVNGTENTTMDIELHGKKVRIVNFEAGRYRIQPEDGEWHLRDIYDAFVKHDALRTPSRCSAESIQRTSHAAKALTPYNGSWTRPSDHFFSIPRRLAPAALGYMRDYRANCSQQGGKVVVMKQIEWLLYKRIAASAAVLGANVQPHWFPELIASPRGISKQGDSKRVTSRTSFRRKQMGWCARFFRDGDLPKCTRLVDAIKLPVAPNLPTRPPSPLPTPLPTTQEGPSSKHVESESATQAESINLD
jgi:hypothetical protein